MVIIRTDFASEPESALVGVLLTFSLWMVAVVSLCLLLAACSCPAACVVRSTLPPVVTLRCPAVCIRLARAVGWLQGLVWQLHLAARTFFHYFTLGALCNLQVSVHLIC